jgi:hypothetical protein
MLKLPLLRVTRGTADGLARFTVGQVMGSITLGRQIWSLGDCLISVRHYWGCAVLQSRQSMMTLFPNVTDG